MKVDKLGRGGFFAVDVPCWRRVCSKGLIPAATYLCMACGTAIDNKSTWWSAEAVRTRIGCRWKVADAAVRTLLDIGAVWKTQGGLAPRYYLPRENDERLIWLPSVLAETGKDGVPPIRRLVETGRTDALALLVQLYDCLDLDETGCIDRDVMHRRYEAKRVGEKGDFILWDFAAHADWSVDETRLDIGLDGGKLRRARKTLVALGLIKTTCCLLSDPGPSGVVLRQHNRVNGRVRHLPVEAHIETPHLIDMALLAHLPRTKRAQKWCSPIALAA